MTQRLTEFTLTRSETQPGITMLRIGAIVDDPELDEPQVYLLSEADLGLLLKRTIQAMQAGQRPFVADRTPRS